jgi:non-ribosomal peptide synthetase component F/thioesterase domain-containing protein
MGDWTRRLSPAARQLLHQPAPVEPVSAGPVLSRAQRRFAYLESLSPGLYNSGRLWTLPQGVDLEHLQACLNRLVERHPLLGTNLRGERGASGAPELILERCVDSQDMEEALQQRLATPLTGQLLESVVYQCGTTWSLFLKTHHAISDFTSRMALGRELARLYAGEELDPLAHSYADYVAQESAWLQGSEAAGQREFWEARLRGAAPLSFGERSGYAGQQLQVELEGRHSFVSRLAALFVLLWNRTAATDLCVALPVSLRDRPELSRMFGCLLNTVLVRITIDPTESFEMFQKRVRHSHLESLAHSRLPFEEAARGQADLASVLLNSLPEAEKQPWPTRRCNRPQAFHPLSFTFSAQGLELEYAQELFSPRSARRLLELYQDLLGRSSLGPQLSVQQIADHCMGHTLQRVHKQVSLQPQALAVRSRTASLSYQELWQRSQRLARQLVHLGVGPGRVVVLRTGRTLQLPQAMLAVWSAGGVTLSVEQGMPALRVQSMLEQASPVLQLVAAGQTALPGVPVHWIDGEGPEADLGQPPSGEQTAYLMFTSGSSGRPKGVALTQANLAHFLESLDSLGWGAVDTVLTAALSFDISLLEILYPLVSGGTCYASELGTSFDPQDLKRVIEASQCSLLQLTPSLWSLLFRSGWQPHSGLRLAVSGGEKLDEETGALLLGHFSESWNCYGPTEATVWISAERIERDGAGRLGRPFPGSRFFLEGEELVLAGPQLGTYLEGPGTRFYVGPAGQPCYRTGDRVVRDADGYRFLGRLDGQLKVGGVRVELAEVETVLRDFCQGDAVVVLARPGGLGLAAFVFGAERDLSALGQRLPAACLPGSVRFLAEPPLNSSGKLDQRALLSLLEHKGAPAACGLDDLEERLIKLWRRRLEQPGLGPDANFLASGGHSLLAAELMLDLERELGVKASPGLLLQQGTPRALAASLREQGDSPWPSLVVFQKGPLRSGQVPFFCFHAQGASVLLYQKLAARFPQELVFCGLEPLAEDLDLQSKARRYAQEIRHFWPHGPYLLGGLSSGGTLAYATAQQLPEVRLVVPFDTVLPGYFQRRPRTLWDRVRALFFHLENLLFYARTEERKDYLRELVRRFRRTPVAPPRPRKRSDSRVEAGSLPVTLLLASHRNQGGADPRIGWRHTTNRLQVENIRGFHGTDLVELDPLVRRLADTLVRVLRAALAPAAVPAAAGLTDLPRTASEPDRDEFR